MITGTLRCNNHIELEADVLNVSWQCAGHLDIFHRWPWACLHVYHIIQQWEGIPSPALTAVQTDAQCHTDWGWCCVVRGWAASSEQRHTRPYHTSWSESVYTKVEPEPQPHPLNNSFSLPALWMYFILHIICPNSFKYLSNTTRTTLKQSWTLRAILFVLAMNYVKLSIGGCPQKTRYPISA